MDKTVKILESVFTISGRILILIESDFGRPGNGTILSDNDGKRWTILNNSLFLDAKNVAKLPNKYKTFFCELEPINHGNRPEAFMLEIVPETVVKKFL